MHTETINKIKSALSDDNTTLINNELSERNAAFHKMIYVEC